MKNSIILPSWQIKNIDNIRAICMPIQWQPRDRWDSVCEIKTSNNEDGLVIAYDFYNSSDRYDHGSITPPYALNKPLIVRETWQLDPTGFDEMPPENWWTYKATQKLPDTCARWRSPSTMPKEAARYILTPTTITAMRVQDVTEDMALKMGCKNSIVYDEIENGRGWSGLANDSICLCTFVNYWDAQYAKRGLGWDANPWVWMCDVKVERR
jgi:hypothetical protein